MADERVPGMSVAVQDPRLGFFSRSYGLGDVTSAAPYRGRSHVRIASISKTFTGIAVLRLVDRGKLSLKDKLGKFVPGIPNGNQITIRQLLGMTGGIYDFTRNDAFNAAFSANPNIPWDPGDVLRILRDPANRPDFPPGERVSYSDSNYVLLGIIIKKVTGNSPRRVIQNKLLRPKGLTETLFPNTSAMGRPFNRGYYAGDDGTGVLRDYTFLNPDVPWTAGSMISNTADLLEWSETLGRGELLSKGLFKKQREFRQIPNPGLNVWYGLGLFKLAGFIGHNGAIYGYNTAMFYLPRARASIVVTGNKSTNFSSESLVAFIEIARKLYPRQFPPS